jgi:hypothetical protein
MAKKVDRINLEVQNDKFVQLVENKSLGEFCEAIVHVKPGESKKSAWARHLFDNPLDENALVKIFIIPSNHKTTD